MKIRLRVAVEVTNFLQKNEGENESPVAAFWDEEGFWII